MLHPPLNDFTIYQVILNAYKNALKRDCTTKNIESDTWDMKKCGNCKESDRLDQMTKNASLGLFGGHLYGPNLKLILGGSRSIQRINFKKYFKN